MLAFEFLGNAIVGSLLAGILLALAGVLLLLLDIPFLGICLSHAAFLGAVIAVLLGMHPLIGAMASCVLAILTIWPIAERTKAGANGALSVVMAGTMGLAFVFMSRLPGPKSEALTLIWGSVLTLGTTELAWLMGTALVTTILVIGFQRWIRAVLYDREIARSCGIPVRAMLFGMLFVAGATVSVSLDIVGGLLIFALLVNPASAAYHLTNQLKWTFALATLFGVISTQGGLWLSYWLDLPTGAVMALVSTLIFSMALIIGPKRNRSLR